MLLVLLCTVEIPSTSSMVATSSDQVTSLVCATTWQGIKFTNGESSGKESAALSLDGQCCQVTFGDSCLIFHWVLCSGSNTIIFGYLSTYT